MNKNYGFTLIELIITLAVVSILLLTGIPTFNELTKSNRLTTQINTIASTLALARSEAIKRGSVITICGSSDESTCDTTSWESGWIVFSDIDKDNVFDSGTDTKIFIQKALNGGSTLRLSNSDVAGVYQFLPDGSSRDRDSSGTTVGTFTLCNQEAEATKAKAININFIGRVSRAEDDSDNGIVEYYNYATQLKVDVTCP